MEKQITINIATKSIIKVILIILGLVFLYYIRDILLLIVIILILVAGLNPTLMLFDKYGFPRLLSVSLVYLFLFISTGLILYIIIPPVVEQIANIITNIPVLIDKLPESVSPYVYNKIISNQANLFNYSAQIKNIGQQFLEYIISFFGSITTIIMVLVVSFYLLLKHDSVEETFFSFITSDKKNQTIKIYQKISEKLGLWFRNRVVLSVLIGFFVFIALALLNVPYALTLGIIAGILDIVPIIGPIISTIVIAIMITVTGFWWQLAVMLAVIILLHQIEDNIIGPKLMGKVTGLSPVIIILVFAIGAKLGGMIGAVLAIPIAAGVYVLIQEWPSVKKLLF